MPFLVKGSVAGNEPTTLLLVKQMCRSLHNGNIFSQFNIAEHYTEIEIIYLVVHP